MNHTYISASFIIIHILIIIIFMLCSFKKGWLNLDHRSLFHQKLFWIAILIPFSSFLLYGAWVWIGHTPDLSPTGFETFYNISKIPLLLLASSVPLASIVNNIHRTIQTEKQINESEKKNQNDGYFNHLKFTTDQFKSIEGKEILSASHANESFKIIILKPMKLYNKFFHKSNNLDGLNYEIDPKTSHFLESKWSEIGIKTKFLNNISNRTKSPEDIELEEILLAVIEINEAYKQICEYLYLYDYNFKSTRKFKLNEKILISEWLDAKDINNSLSELKKIITKIMDVLNENSIRDKFEFDKLEISDPRSRINAAFATLFTSYQDLRE